VWVLFAVTMDVGSKFQMGADIHGSIRFLCLEETYTLPGLVGLASLQAKHLILPQDRRAIPRSYVPPLLISYSEVLAALKSFNPGSSGGIDSLRHQHIGDMLDGVSADHYLDVLTDLVNVVLSGGLPLVVRPIYFGG